MACVCCRKAGPDLAALFRILTSASPAVWFCQHTHTNTHTPADCAQKNACTYNFWNNTWYSLVSIANAVLFKLKGTERKTQYLHLLTFSNSSQMRSDCDILIYITYSNNNVRTKIWNRIILNTMLTFLSSLKTTSMSHPSENVSNGAYFSNSPQDPALWNIVQAKLKRNKPQPFSS